MDSEEVNEGEKGEFVFNGYEANPDALLPKVKDVAAPALRAVTIFAALPPFPASQQPSTKKTIEFAQRLATSILDHSPVGVVDGAICSGDDDYVVWAWSRGERSLRDRIGIPNIDIRSQIRGTHDALKFVCKSYTQVLRQRFPRWALSHLL